jgi:DNA-binding MarR family transcriptional regulator
MRTTQPSPPLDPVAPWRAMLLAQSSALRAIEADLRRSGAIALTWYDVLLELRGAGGRLRMQDLGDRVVLSRTRVSRLVDELETEGLARREPDPADRRGTFAVITDAGRAALKAAAPVYLAGIDAHFARHLSPSEQRCITRGLTRVAEAGRGAAARPAATKRGRSG